ncbi:MAG: uracil-DNA glycosylase [Anaerolineaceae bacterium]|nr:uracil-DNA glycosylase [Anaerolineaceae bacterium]
MESVKLLEEIGKEVSQCVKCRLHTNRKKSVPGEGPANSEILLIGEGPGFHENEQGRPFVGASGKFLGELLNAIGLNREDVFIANVVKCRPPSNRDPLLDELTECGNFLNRQIEAINPLIIVTLGRFSMGKYFPSTKISQIHGQAHWINDRLIVPMYHPAAALHQPKLRTTILDDFKKLPQFIEDARKQRPKPEAAPEEDIEEPKQLNLF